MIMRLSLPLVVLMLSACTNLNRDFSCDAKSGVGCKSISEVNTMVNTGQLQQSVSINSQQKTQVSPKSITPGKVQGASMTQAPPTRINEISMPIWLAPFTDNEDNFHSSSTVYTVITPGFWEHEAH